MGYDFMLFISPKFINSNKDENFIKTMKTHLQKSVGNKYKVKYKGHMQNLFLGDPEFGTTVYFSLQKPKSKIPKLDRKKVHFL
jgi:hypothetical protein